MKGGTERDFWKGNIISEAAETAVGVLGHTQAQPPPEGVAVPEGGNTRIGIGREGSTRNYLGKVQSKEWKEGRQ